MVRSTCSSWFGVFGGRENTCFYNGLWLCIWWFCVTICGFCWFLQLDLLYCFFRNHGGHGYWWIWLCIHNREKRKIEVLSFREFGYGFTISISPQPYQTPGFSKFFSKSSLYVGKHFFFFFLRFNTNPLLNFLSLFGFQENKREKDIGYCSFCCLSFILLCKS